MYLGYLFGNSLNLKKKIYYNNFFVISFVEFVVYLLNINLR